MNGLGRFGEHALRLWLDCPGALSINYLNDVAFDVEAVVHRLRHHDKLDFSDANPGVENGCLALTRRDGLRLRIRYTRCAAPEVPWLGEPALWLECSGHHPTAAECRAFLSGRTRQVWVSATCWDADQTLVFGFNHESWLSARGVFSYGSCTVNAFVPLAQWLHTRYGVRAADVHVVHNVPSHKLTADYLPRRHTCTLQGMGPRLLPWLRADRFLVNYTLIPYTGVSLIDFRFELDGQMESSEISQALEAAVRDGALAGLYELRETDDGPDACALSAANAVFMKHAIAVKGDSLYLSGYFDNENSAARYLDILRWVASRWPKD